MTIDAGPRLSREETGRLCRLAQAGDVEARNSVVMANYGLAHRLAAHAARGGVPLDDLIQEAVLGLMRAVETYDSDVAAFSTYAVGWIKQRLCRWVESQRGRVRVPHHAIQAMPMVRREQDNHPTIRAAAVAVAEAQGHAGRAEAYYRAAVSLDGLTVPPDELPDRYEPPDPDAPEAGARLASHLGRLDERSRLVLERRYGLNGHEPGSLADVARVIGLTKERARQIGEAAIRDLRGMMSA